MKTIGYFVHGNNAVTVHQIADAAHARECFDGTDREWHEMTDHVRIQFYYIVSYGLRGLYMSDGVGVFTNQREAMSYARSIIRLWKDEDSEVEA